MRLFLLILIIVFSAPSMVLADSHMDMPRQSSGTIKTAHRLLNLTPDKSEMIQLEKEAASVIVGNPNHINVILDTPTTLIVVPREAGASHFSVIGKDGSILLERQVVVGAPKNSSDNKYVRIRRSCASSSSRDCQPSSVYFCDGTCHEVSENTNNRR